MFSRLVPVTGRTDFGKEDPGGIPEVSGGGSLPRSRFPDRTQVGIVAGQASQAAGQGRFPLLVEQGKERAGPFREPAGHRDGGFENHHRPVVRRNFPTGLRMLHPPGNRSDPLFVVAPQAGAVGPERLLVGMCGRRCVIRAGVRRVARLAHHLPELRMGSLPDPFGPRMTGRAPRGERFRSSVRMDPVAIPAVHSPPQVPIRTPLRQGSVAQAAAGTLRTPGMRRVASRAGGGPVRYRLAGMAGATEKVPVRSLSVAGTPRAKQRAPFPLPQRQIVPVHLVAGRASQHPPARNVPILPIERIPNGKRPGHHHPGRVSRFGYRESHPLLPVAGAAAPFRGIALFPLHSPHPGSGPAVRQVARFTDPVPCDPPQVVRSQGDRLLVPVAGGAEKSRRPVRFPKHLRQVRCPVHLVAGGAGKGSTHRHSPPPLVEPFHLPRAGDRPVFPSRRMSRPFQMAGGTDRPPGILLSGPHPVHLVAGSASGILSAVRLRAVPGSPKPLVAEEAVARLLEPFRQQRRSGNRTMDGMAGAADDFAGGTEGQPVPCRDRCQSPFRNPLEDGVGQQDSLRFPDRVLFLVALQAKIGLVAFQHRGARGEPVDPVAPEAERLLPLQSVRGVGPPPFRVVRVLRHHLPVAGSAEERGNHVRRSKPSPPRRRSRMERMAGQAAFPGAVRGLHRFPGDRFPAVTPCACLFGRIAPPPIPVHGVAARTSRQLDADRPIPCAGGDRMTARPVEASRVVAPETDRIRFPPEKRLPVPAMRPVAFPAASSRETGPVESRRSGSVAGMAPGTDRIAAPGKPDAGVAQDLPSPLFVRRMAGGTGPIRRCALSLPRRGMLRTPPEGAAMVENGSVVAAHAYPFLAEPVAHLVRQIGGIDIDAVPDVAEGAGLLVECRLPVGRVRRDCGGRPEEKQEDGDPNPDRCVLSETGHPDLLSTRRFPA